MSKIWGTPTWYFFHSFAQHINDNFYKENKDQICDLLRNICFNLPCETCSKHATDYTKSSLKGSKIHNKEQLKKYFYDFHNVVNRRKKKGIFTNFDIYKNSKLFFISRKFFHIYSGYKNPHRGFSDQLNRNTIISKLKELLTNNSDKFVWKN